MPLWLYFFFCISPFFKVLPKYTTIFGYFALCQITYTITEPEVAFTGDTTSDFIVDENNIDVLRAKILVMEVWY